MADIHLGTSDWQEGSQGGMTAEMADGSMDQGLSRAQFERWHEEIKKQPAWRSAADKAADYYDGNQLDSDALRKAQSIGMAPAIEPLIGPVIDSVLGMEAQRRTDWRVIPDSEDGTGDDVATALNHKLNTAERHARADRACSDAFAGQAKVGIGWVEVGRDSNPFNYPYRCSTIPRNEIYWDWRSKELDLSDARYLIRRKWTDREQAALLFPDQAQLIRQASTGWSGWDTNLTMDGGRSTGLEREGSGPGQAYGAIAVPLPGQVVGTSQSMLSAYYAGERGTTLEEQEWRDQENNRVCLFEVWYRVWIRALCMKLPDGRVVEYDPCDEMHVAMVALGGARPNYSVISKVRVSWWLGPHRLSDDSTPYKHNKFPYVPFWGKREDRTGVPFGLIRGMMYLQDAVNVMFAKVIHGLSAIRSMRTAGAAIDDDDTVRQQLARPDCDILLVNDFKTKGHVFEVERDFQLNDSQKGMMSDAREGIMRVGGITNAYEGRGTASQSGVAVSNLAEQSQQTLADLYDNFITARTEVGELLLSMIAEDMIGKPVEVVIKGNALTQERRIQLNVPAIDQESGTQYLDNDIERTLLKVTMEDVPSTPSFKSQQLQSFTEIYKSAPEKYQAALFPRLLALMDVPDKEDAIKAIQEADKEVSPEEQKMQLDQQTAQATIESRMRELDLKAALNEATIKNLVAQAVKTMNEAQFAAIQTAQGIATMPQIAPVADVVMENSGFQMPMPAGDNPNYPQTSISVPPLQVNRNTHPEFSPEPKSPMTGVETLRNENA